MRKSFVVLFVLFFCIEASVSQNIEKIGKKDALKVNGSANYNSIFYDSRGIPLRRDPFTWYFNGSINFSILDWSIPFSYSYSNQQGAFTQPFNQYGLAPQYKWFKGYAGYCSITFSPYTLSGYVFVGGAAEMNPGKWKFATMYGRMNKVVPYDAINSMSDNMAYERWGKGLRAGYEDKGNGIYINYFHAKDNISSLLFVPTEANLLPQENTVMSIEGKSKISKSVFFETEYALSGITRNLFSETDKERKNYLWKFYSLRSGSYFSNAFKATLGYKQKRIGLNLGYERVAPDYQTLGTYYFNNDMENITVSPSFRLLKEKLSLSFNTGLQRNNLDGKKLSTVRRWVGSTNITYNINTKMMLAASYSNFSTYTKLRPLGDPYYTGAVDTLNFYQLSQNSNLVFNYMFKRTEKTIQSLTNTFTYQVSGEKNNDRVNIPSTVINANIGYTVSKIKTKASASFIVNINQSNFYGTSKIYIGPGCSFSKVFSKTVKATIGSTYNFVASNGEMEGSLINDRINFNWTPRVKNEKHGKPSVGISIVELHRFKTPTKTATDELTAMVNLMYGFKGGSIN